MGNGTKFKLSSMFPSVLNKIKGMTGKRTKGKGALTNPSDWSEDLQDFSIVSKDSPGSPPSPVRTFPQNRDRDIRYCSSPRCSSPINHKSYDIRFPTESPVRRGMKMGPVSPPRRSANSTDSGCCSFDSTLALVPQDRVRRAVPPLFGRCLQRSKCNSFNSDTHSDSEVDITDSEPQSARAHLRARTMSLQLDGITEWERERERDRERDWSEPEKSASSSRRRRMRDSTSKISAAGEPSPIHTVRCMPPNTPSDAGNYSDPRDIDHRSACPDFSREMSSDHNVTLRFDRKLSFTADDNRLFDDIYTSLSSDEDFFKVRSGHNAIGQYRLKKLNKFGNADLADAGYASGEVVLTEDEERSLRLEAVLAKTVRNAAASDGWARVQSRFAEEEKHAHQLSTTRGGRVSYDRKAADESEVLLTEDERHHAAMCRREASLVKTVLSAKDWARENLRALSKASELEKQAKQQLRATDAVVEYESFGLPVIHKEHLHSRLSSKTHSPVGEVEKHTKGKIDYKSSQNDLQDNAADNLVYEQFSQPLAEYASDFYKNAQTEESDFETSIAARPWEVEFPSFRSDRGSRRSGPLELSESDGPTPNNHRFSAHERPKKQIPTSTAAREALVRKTSRSASPKVLDVPVNSMKPSSRSGSPRTQELHSGKRATSPRTPSSARQEVASKKNSRSQSPRRQEVSGKKPSSNAQSPGQQPEQQNGSNCGNHKKANARSGLPAPSTLESEKKKGGGSARVSSQTRPQEERTSVMGSDSVAVVKASYDPYQDFRESMVEMILENDIQTAEDLEELLQCYLSLNSAEYHSIIVQVFSDIWRDIFDH